MYLLRIFFFFFFAVKMHLRQWIIYLILLIQTFDRYDQGPWFVPLLRLLSVWSTYACSPHACLGFLWVSFQKHACKWIGYSELDLAVNKCVNNYSRHALRWTGVLSRVYSSLAHGVPSIDSIYIETLTRLVLTETEKMNLITMQITVLLSSWIIDNPVCTFCFG